MTTKRLTDFAAYIVIGLALGLMAIAFAENNIDAKWLALSFETALVFGCVIAEQKRRWKTLTFWLLCVAILAAHLGLSATLLLHIATIRAFWVSVAFVVETSVIIVFLDAIAPRLLRRQQ
jgi:hypothetical protein